VDHRIRPACATDLPTLVRLLGELFTLEADFTRDPERQHFGLALMLSDRRSRAVLVAERGGEVIGMVTAQLVVSTAEGGLSALVEDMVVDAGSRGRGVGRALLAAIEGWAVERGATRLQLLADRENAPALAFYGRAAWSPTRLVCLRRSPARR
jgi:GNAT superfamily N-acetyltransferase